MFNAALQSQEGSRSKAFAELIDPFVGAAARDSNRELASENLFISRSRGIKQAWGLPPSPWCDSVSQQPVSERGEGCS